MSSPAAVLDTNVVLAGNLASSSSSPNRELLVRWINEEFIFLYSIDTKLEYIEKMLHLGIARPEIVKFIRSLHLLGQSVTIQHYHFRVYPTDPDDVPFFLCAVNGGATHLITYDTDFEPVRNNQWFEICTPLEFLTLLR